MTGILFHGPEVFDSGWGGRIAAAFSCRCRARMMLAGTMARTALFDSGLKNVETPGLQPSQCVKLLEKNCSEILLATYGKSERSGFIFGSLVVQRALPVVPLIQAECSAMRYAVRSRTCPPPIAAKLKALGFLPSNPPEARIETWNEKGTFYRRMTTAEKGDFILVNGIVVGRALGSDVVLASKACIITGISGVRVKQHGLEKIERLGGVDLAIAKLASTRSLRGGRIQARVRRLPGKGIVFIDHAGMDVYNLAGGVEGAVTVGDDTTAVAGDILYRFGIPVLGIVDGDGDMIIGRSKLYPGSAVFLVKADDIIGVKVFKELFNQKVKSALSFAEMKGELGCLIANNALSRTDY